LKFIGQSSFWFLFYVKFKVTFVKFHKAVSSYKRINTKIKTRKSLISIEDISNIVR
jgi:hypothetical protein